MSDPSTSLPPLPPPTVPSRNPIVQPPPPEPKRSAPLESSPHPSPYSPNSPQTPLMDEQSDQHPEPDQDLPKKRRPPKCCCCPFRLRFTPHHIHEPARSLWFDTRILLIFRLAVTAVLLGHLVFFSLRGDFSFRLYSTWNYVGLSAAFLLVVMSSLLDVLRDEDSYNPDQIDATTQGEGMVTDIERHPVGRPPMPDPKVARFLTPFAVPLYQIFISASLFGATIYWSAIYVSSDASITYPLVMLTVFAPAAALLDFLLSLRMRFRFLYVLLYTLYNGSYVGALVLFDKLLEDPVYALFDPSVQSTKEFVAKAAGIGGASVVAGLLMYALSYVPLISCFPGKKEGPKKSDSVDDSDASRTSDSDVSSHSSGVKSPNVTDQDPKNTASNALGEVNGNDNGNSRSDRSIQVKDRLSVRVSSSGTISPSNSGKWFRSSSARMVASLSGHSIGSDDRQDSFARSDSGKQGNWDSLGQPSARVEDEYFAMPAAASGEREVIKLTPLPRNESASSLPGFLSRSSSGRMSRPGSRQMSRSGSRTILVRSQSDRSVAVKSFSKSASTTSLR